MHYVFNEFKKSLHIAAYNELYLLHTELLHIGFTIYQLLIFQVQGLFLHVVADIAIKHCCPDTSVIYMAFYIYA